MPKNRLTHEGDGFQVEVKANAGGFQAKVRLVDEGIRGKNVVYYASTADELTNDLSRLVQAGTVAQQLVTDLANQPVQPEPGPDTKPEKPREDFLG